MKLIALSGSLSLHSLNSALLQAAKTHMPTDAIMEIVSIKGIPLYNSDDEKKKGIPQSVESIKSKIVASDGLLISTPEYNHSIPGVLKNAVDWLSRPSEDIPRVFGNRPVGLIGASPSRLGTAFSQTAWLPILRRLNTRPYFDNALFVASAHTVFDKQGNLVDDTVRKLLQDYINGFCSFVNKQCA